MQKRWRLYDPYCWFQWWWWMILLPILHYDPIYHHHHRRIVVLWIVLSIVVPVVAVAICNGIKWISIVSNGYNILYKKHGIFSIQSYQYHHHHRRYFSILVVMILILLLIQYGQWTTMSQIVDYSFVPRHWYGWRHFTFNRMNHYWEYKRVNYWNKRECNGRNHYSSIHHHHHRNAIVTIPSIHYHHNSNCHGYVYFKKRVPVKVGYDKTIVHQHCIHLHQQRWQFYRIFRRPLYHPNSHRI